MAIDHLLALELLSQGVAQAEVARRLGCSRQTISRIAKGSSGNGMERAKGGRAVDPVLQVELDTAARLEARLKRKALEIQVRELDEEDERELILDEDALERKERDEEELTRDAASRILEARALAEAEHLALQREREAAARAPLMRMFEQLESSRQERRAREREAHIAAKEQQRQIELLLSIRSNPEVYAEPVEAAWFSCPGCQASFLVEGLAQCPACGCSLLREI